MRVALWIGAALVLIVAGSASAENTQVSSFQCGGGIVKVGDPEYEVKEKCGTPTSVQAGDSGPILIYDAGSTSFVRSVYLSGGKVTRIEHGDYGTAPPAPVPTPAK